MGLNGKKNTIMHVAIKNILPLGFPWQTQDPFLFCVYHEDFFPKGNKDLGPDDSLAGRNIGNDFTIKNGYRMYHGSTVPGFPAHPHRGFETVTVVKKGMCDHADSLGAVGRYGNGDVQWMTAGKGVQHSEMFPLLKSDEPNPLELFQIWLNLPSNKKMVNGHIKMLWRENIETFKGADDNGNSVDVEVIAGDYKSAKAVSPAPNSWAANHKNRVAIWKITLAPNALWEIPLDEKEVNRTLFFYKGNNINIGNENISVNKVIQLHSDERVSIKNGDEEGCFLLLQGKPLNEPVVQHGPFVMSNEAEIRQTMIDYQKTQFGGWPWPKYELVHPKDKGRFVKHASGEVEEKEVKF